jgi:glycosyl transferase family 87
MAGGAGDRSLRGDAAIAETIGAIPLGAAREPMLAPPFARLDAAVCHRADSDETTLWDGCDACVGCFIHSTSMATLGAGRRSILLLVGVFIVTRLVLAVLADSPDRYGTAGTKVVGDVDVYRGWADSIVDEHRTPYSEVAIEYPPAVLPFALAPKLAGDESYRKAFIGLMLLVDVAGLAGLYVIGRRRGSLLGPWLWALGVVALGPIVYLRLDLIPAVATIWALERASAHRWIQSGAWLGLGFVAKIYPIFILPVVVIMSPKRRSVVLGAVAVTVVALAPYAFSIDSLFTSVVKYHAERGLQVESVWGAVLLAAGHFGYGTVIEYNFGAFHLASAISPLFKKIADVASLVALGTGTLFAVRLARRDEPELLPETSFATLACILALGTVFSPQFMVWLLALGAVVACSPRSQVLIPALCVLPLCALTQLIYPFLYDQLILHGPHELGAQVALVARDLGVLGVGVAAFWILWSHKASARAIPA